MLIDRAISTFIVSAVLAIVAGSIVAGFTGWFTGQTPEMPFSFWMWSAYFGFLAGCIYLSYRLFINGETLRGWKRYRVLARAWLFDIGIIYLALFVAYWLIFK